MVNKVEAVGIRKPLKNTDYKEKERKRMLSRELLYKLLDVVSVAILIMLTHNIA